MGIYDDRYEEVFYFWHHKSLERRL